MIRVDAGNRLLKKEKSGYSHKGNNHLFLYYSCSYTLTSTSPFLFSRFHRYTSRCSSPWLELSGAGHKLYSMTFVKATNRHVRETSSDKGLFFPSYTHFIYTNHSEQLQDFDLCGNLIHGQMPYMKFLYVRSDVCRQLLSDSTSQWTPLLLAIQFPLLGLVRDLHPLE